VIYSKIVVKCTLTSVLSQRERRKHESPLILSLSLLGEG